MSRIGRLPVSIPPKVKVSVSGRTITVEGPKGTLKLDLPKRTDANVADGQVKVGRDGEDAEAKSMHGLARALINNMVVGVSEGFVKKLEIHGVGFKAVVQGKVVNLNLGYSHEINYALPENVTVKVDENTKLTIEGVSKELVGKAAAEIRSFYPPEPYKGKGVRYAGEQIVRKEGKTVQ